jgi:hypothetical protein
MHAIRPYWVRSLAPAALGLCAVALVSARLGAFTIPEPDASPLALSDGSDAVEVGVEVAHEGEASVVDVGGEEAAQLELELEITRSNPSCAYYSAWDREGVVEIPADVTQVVFETPFEFMDGCSWRSREELVRVGPGRYRYSYSEAAESCPAGRSAAAACTRSGMATLVQEE